MLQTYGISSYLRAILLGLSLFSLCAAADGLIKSELKSQTPSIYVDTWSGRSENLHELFTRIYVEFYPADLTFQADNGGYIARPQIQVYIMDENKEQVAVAHRSDEIRVEKYTQTVKHDGRQHMIFRFPLAEGRYSARIHLVDDHLQKEAIVEKDFAVASPSQQSIDLSDILLAHKEEVLTAANKVTKTILPHPEKVYGLLHSRLYCSFDIYQTHSGTRDSINYTISYIDPQNESHLLESRKLSSRLSRIPVNYSFDTKELPPGTYQLIVQVNAGEQRQQIQRTTTFEVQQDLFDLRFYAYDDILNELELIADPGEIKQLKKLPESERQQAVYAFWEKRDPTPGTIANEAMQEFYRRLNYAQAYFGMSANSSRGYLTDRAKVYIVFGAPDSRKRERLSNRLFGVQETWFYQDRSLQLTFHSPVGEGDFYLMEPFKFLERH